MRLMKWQIWLGLVLILLSVSLYLLHYFLFHDNHHIWIFLVGDIAFVPIEVLLVTLIIHRLLNIREKRSLLNKLNMVIGTFYSEVGTVLLKTLSAFDPHSDKISRELIPTPDWTDREFSQLRQKLKAYEYTIDYRRGDLKGLKNFLLEKRPFLLSLLENPNLLEHDSFTNLLWAVFHLSEELGHRHDVKGLRDSDYQHLCGDIKRVYALLVSEWIDYTSHLKKAYPYLFSLAMRTNPFDPDASPEIK